MIFKDNSSRKSDFIGLVIIQDDVIREVGEGLAGIFAFPDSDEMIGLVAEDILSEGIEDIIENGVEGDYSGAFKSTGKKKNGATFEVSVSIEKIQYENRPAYRCIILDTSRHSEYIREFRTFRAMVDLSLNAIFYFDDNGDLQYHNKALLDFIPPSEPVSDPINIYSVFPKNIGAEFRSWVEDRGNNDHFRLEIDSSSESNFSRDIIFFALKLRDERQEILTVAGMFVDNTGQKESERTLNKLRIDLETSLDQHTVELEQTVRRLEEERSKYRHLFDNALVGIFRLTSDLLTVINVNNKAVEVTGYSKSELAGIDMLKLWPDSEAREKTLKSIAEKKEFIEFETELKSKSGDVRSISVSIRNYYESGFIEGTLLDITDQKGLERSLRRRIETEKLFTVLAAGFINLPLEEIDRELNRAFEMIAKGLEADGCFYYEINAERGELHCLYRWYSEEIEKSRWLPKIANVDDYTWSFSQYKTGKEVVVNDFENEVSADASGERNLHLITGMKSIMVIPILIRGDLIGIMGANSWSENKTFHDSDLSLLRMSGIMLGNVLEKKKTENELQQAIDDLEKSRKELLKKNIALNQLIGVVESEKVKIRNSIQSNLDRTIIPFIKDLKKSLSSSENSRLDILEEYLANISSSFINNLEALYRKLTPREVEICNMIRKGFASKKIADALNISPATVNKHREQIRKKFNIHNKNVNLTMYLQSL